MGSLLRLVFIGFLALNIISCGGSDKNKGTPYVNTEDLISEKRDLTLDVVSTGYPNTSWSMERIADYEKKIDRLEEIESLLMQNQSISSFGADSLNMRIKARKKIEEVRAQKVKMAQEELEGKNGSGTGDNVVNPPAGSQDGQVANHIPGASDELNRQYDEIVGSSQLTYTRLMKAGAPSVKWSIEDLDAYIVLVDELLLFLSNATAFLDKHQAEIPAGSLEMLRTIAQQNEEEFTGLKEQANQTIEDKKNGVTEDEPQGDVIYLPGASPELNEQFISILGSFNQKIEEILADEPSNAWKLKRLEARLALLGEMKATVENVSQFIDDNAENIPAALIENWKVWVENNRKQSSKEIANVVKLIKTKKEGSEDDQEASPDEDIAEETGEEGSDAGEESEEKFSSDKIRDDIVKIMAFALNDMGYVEEVGTPTNDWKPSQLVQYLNSVVNVIRALEAYDAYVEVNKSKLKKENYEISKDFAAAQLETYRDLQKKAQEILDKKKSESESEKKLSNSSEPKDEDGVTPVSDEDAVSKAVTEYTSEVQMVMKPIEETKLGLLRLSSPKRTWGKETIEGYIKKVDKVLASYNLALKIVEMKKSQLPKVLVSKDQATFKTNIRRYSSLKKQALALVADDKEEPQASAANQDDSSDDDDDGKSEVGQVLFKDAVYGTDGK